MPDDPKTSMPDTASAVPAAPSSESTPTASEQATSAVKPSGQTATGTTTGASATDQVAVEQKPAAPAIPHISSDAIKTEGDTLEMEQKEEEKKSGKLFWVIVAVLAVLILGLGVFAMYRRYESGGSIPFFGSKSEEPEEQEGEEPEEGEEEDNDEEEGDEEDEEDEADTGDADTDADDGAEQFAGQYVTGEYPDGWQIVEYINGEGSTMLVGGVTYTGLTGLEIFAPGDKLVFTMEAVNGIGGVEACGNYYEFPDSSDEYYDEIVDLSAEAGVVPTVVEIEAGDYTEFSFFEARMRRNVRELFWDKTPADETDFNASCGIGKNIPEIDAPFFVADGTNMMNYLVSIDPATTEAELVDLDNILDSLAAD